MKMKTALLGSVALSFALPGSSFAQSSVTLYGIVDAGFTYVSNSAGSTKIAGQSGVVQGSRWGLKGSEDLGGGLKALFQIENGFNVFTGKLAQGGLGFGRQAYVGLSDNSWGTLTLGRQYDPVVDIVQPTTLNGHWGALFSHPSDIDNSNNGFRVNNAVKYVSPNFNGLSGEVMYAFGGVAGSFGNKSTIAVGASYSNGPAYVGVAYFYARDPSQQFADGNFVTGSYGGNVALTPGSSNGLGAFGYVGAPTSMQVAAFGGTYTAGPFVVGADYTNTRFANSTGFSGNTVTFNNFELWSQYNLTPATTLAGGYTFTMGKVDYNGAKPKYNQFNLLADYRLSARTDVYVMGVVQQSAGGAKADVYDGFPGDQSGTNSQVIARIGLRHKF